MKRYVVTLTIQLPQNVEQAYVDAAHTKGVSIDALVTDVLVSHAPDAAPTRGPVLVEEMGIPVLRAGAPLDPSVVDATLDAVRREREGLALGLAR